MRFSIFDLAARTWRESAAAAFLLFTVAGVAPAQILRETNLPGDRQPGAPRRIVLRLTAEAFAPIVDRDIDETHPVHDTIVGTPVRGRSRTTGKPTVSLIEDNKSASFLLTLKGTAVSRTVGYSDPARIYSRSETYFTATKRVVFEPGKGFVAQPARINARTRIITEGIGSTYSGLRGRIVQRRAGPLVAAKRPAAEEETRQKAMRRIATTFDRNMEERLARLNRATDIREAIAFILRGETEPRYSACTVDGCVQIVASAGRDDTPASEIQLPKLERDAAPIQIWIHDSLIGNNLAFLLKRIDAIRQEPGTVARTIAATAAGFQPQPSAVIRNPSDTPFDYATAGDWFVVQIEVVDEPAKAGIAKVQPSRTASSTRVLPQATTRQATARQATTQRVQTR